MGTLDFFLLESGDYLEQLDGLAQSPAGTPPAGDEFLRVTRAFRGSALMASQHAMARAAQGLEACARALRERRLAWTEGVRAELIRAIDDCKVLARRLRQPEQGDTERAEALGAALDRLSGRASAVMRAVTGPGLDAGGRAFVAREAAAIASTLQRTAQLLAGDPTNRDALGSVIPSMSALRGVAALSDLPPLADLLAAIEGAVREVAALAGAASADVAGVFDAGARALARAAREVVDDGRPSPESDDARQFAARLLHAFAGGQVVAIESLFYADAGPHIVREGHAPETAHPGYGAVEMVSQGEFLTAATTELHRVAGMPVQRDLRLFVIAARLRPMVGAGGSPLDTALGHVAETARDAIGRGAAGAAPEEFIALMGHAAEALAAAQRGSAIALAERLESAASGLASMAGPRSTRKVDMAAAAAADAREVTVPPPSRAPAAVAAPDTGGLAAAWHAFAELVAARGLPPGSLEELLHGPVAAPLAATPTATPAIAAAAVPEVPGRTTAPRAMPIVPIETIAVVAETIVPVEALLYRGERALRRALELKPAIDALAGTPDDPRLTALLREVFDLVELGLDAGR